MKRLMILIMSAAILFLSCALSGCEKEEENSLDTVNSNFKGIGFEWDMYDSMNNWNAKAYEFAKLAADGIKPSKIRIMFDIDKYCTSFGTTNTPVYDFETESMLNLYDILNYCQTNDIEVALGIWHARHEGSYVFDAVKDEGSALFAKVVTDMLSHLINVKEYSCIKILVPYNEPNYTRRYRNSVLVDPYTLWAECMNNLISEINARTFRTEVKLAGPDMSTLTESGIWLQKAERDFSDNLGIYEMHIYPSEYLVSNGKLTDRIKSIMSKLEKDDRDFWIYESGIFDGIVENSGQSNIKTYNYGILMADLTVQSILSGVDGVLYWSFDSKMHQSNGVDSDFGLINSQSKEKRPWYYSTLMLSRSLSRGTKVYKIAEEDKFRAIMVENDTGVYALLINQSSENKSIDLKFNSSKDKGEIYSYVFNKDNFLFDGDGNILPTDFIKQSFKKGFSYEVTANSFTVVCTEKY